MSLRFTEHKDIQNLATSRTLLGKRRRDRDRSNSRRRPTMPLAVVQLEDRLLLAVLANPAASSSQWANLAPGSSWVNGNVNQSKAAYLEGDNVPYRVEFSNLTTGTSNPHTIVIQWDTTKGGKHAMDNLQPAHRRCNSRKGAKLESL